MLFPFTSNSGKVPNMDLTLEDVERVLRIHLSKYKNLDRWEDGIQEGLIRAWKDMQDGMSERWKILNRAKMWARNFILNPDGRRHPTGHIPIGRERGSKQEGKYIKPLTTPDGHIDYAAYKYTSLDTSVFEDDERGNALDIPIPSFEDESVERMDFLAKLEGMDKKAQTALVMSMMYGYSVPEIGRVLGYEKHPQPNGYKILHKAIKNVKESL